MNQSAVNIEEKKALCDGRLRLTDFGLSLHLCNRDRQSLICKQKSVARGRDRPVGRLRRTAPWLEIRRVHCEHGDHAAEENEDRCCSKSEDGAAHAISVFTAPRKR